MHGIGCETGNVHLKMLYILHKCFVRIYCISTRIRYRRRPRELGSILRCVFLFCRLLEIRKSFSPSLFCHRSRYRCVQIMSFYENVYIKLYRLQILWISTSCVLTPTYMHYILPLINMKMVGCYEITPTVCHSECLICEQVS